MHECHQHSPQFLLGFFRHLFILTGSSQTGDRVSGPGMDFVPASFRTLIQRNGGSSVCSSNGTAGIYLCFFPGGVGCRASVGQSRYYPSQAVTRGERRRVRSERFAPRSGQGVSVPASSASSADDLPGGVPRVPATAWDLVRRALSLGLIGAGDHCRPFRGSGVEEDSGSRGFRPWLWTAAPPGLKKSSGSSPRCG